MVRSLATEDLGGGNYGSTSEICNRTLGPVGVDDFYNTNEDTGFGDNVLNNDSDPESDPITASLTTDVTNGTLVLNGDGSFTYTPDADFNGTDSFVYEVCDDTAPINYCAQATAFITITAVNDAPTVDNNTVSTNEDVTYVFTVANDFTVNYNDVESDPFVEIRITSLESVGSLLLGGSPVALNDVITSAQLAGSQLTFVPVADQNGSPYDSFDFEIGDGTDFSTSDYTLTINVTPVNDPPTVDNNTVSTNEDATYVFTVAEFTLNYNDTESDPFAEIKITSLESVGSLLLGGSPVALNDVITSAQLAGKPADLCAGGLTRAAVPMTVLNF